MCKKKAGLWAGIVRATTRMAFAVILCLVPFVTYAESTDARPRFGMALPGEACRFRLDDVKKEWTDADEWAWAKICEGKTADFTTRPNATSDPGKPKHPDENAADQRTLSHNFLKTILLHEPFRSAIPYWGVHIVGAVFQHDVDLRNGIIDRRLSLEKSVFEASVRLNQVTASASVSFKGSKFLGTLDMNEISIKQGLFMSSNAEFAVVDLKGASIGGNLDMEGSTFHGMLNMDGIHVGQSLFMRKHAEFAKVDLKGAEIGGQISMTEATVHEMLSMDTVSIGENLFMDELKSFGIVQLTGAEIGGQISMARSMFRGMLNMDGIHVGQSLFMHEHVSLEEVSLTSADIVAQVDIAESAFLNGLRMDSISIGQSLFVREGTISNVMTLHSSHIHDDLDIESAKIGHLDLTGVQIDGELRLGPLVNDVIRMTLQNATVGALRDSENSWPSELELEGFSYDRLGGFQADKNQLPHIRKSDWYIGWLALDQTYSPQPYQHLARILKDAGHEEMANDILFASRERDFRESWPQEKAKWLSLLGLRMTIGYGYGWRYFWVLGWIVLFAAIGTCILRWEKKYHVDGKRLGFWYSLDMLLPIIRLREAHYDVDLSNDWVAYYFYVHKMIGYILVFFVIAGLTGLTE